jgi:hypothetical protein
VTRLAAALSADGARRLLPVAGANAVPVAGVFLAGWDGATALTLYWWENLVGSLLIAVRILVHRLLTRKRGHWRLQISLAAHNERGGGGRAPQGRAPQGRAPQGGRGADGARPGSFLGEFLAAGLAATAVHGLMLWVVVRRLLGEGPEAEQLRAGVLAVAGFQVLGLAIDLVGIRDRPFSWIRKIAETGVQRVTLVHLVVIVGWWVSLKRGGLDGFFGPFAVLKALADFGTALSILGVNVYTEEAPGWLTATMRRIAPGRGDFAEYWRGRREEERRLHERDEEVVPEGERPGRRRIRKRKAARTGG